MSYVYQFQAWLQNPWTYVLILLGYILTQWIVGATKIFQREPPGIFWEAFSDEYGHVDFKQLGVAWVVFLMSVMVIVALIDPKRYFEGYFLALAGIAGGGLLAVGAGTFSYNRARGGRRNFTDEDGDDYENNIDQKANPSVDTPTDTTTQEQSA
jgi:MFS family permease